MTAFGLKEAKCGSGVDGYSLDCMSIRVPALHKTPPRHHFSLEKNMGNEGWI